MTESHMFPRVEAWSPRFWELFWAMETNRMALARYFMRGNWK